MHTRSPIDVDTPTTWPDATRLWAETNANQLVGSTEFLADLALSPEQEDEFRKTFGPRKLIAYHCSRLLPREVGEIRDGGLRLLNEQLVQDRIAAAVAFDEIPAEARLSAQTGNVFATENTLGRLGQICFVAGQAAFVEDASGLDPFLRYWGGEAIRGGPDDVSELATIGTPAIVVAQLDLTRRHDDPYSWPALAKLFVGSLLELSSQFATVHYRSPVAGDDVLAVWRPGEREYDRYTALPR